MNSQELINLTEQFSAHNYSPLDVVLRSGEGVWVTDIEGHRYLDLLSGYSALNFGHRHPRLVQVAHRQLDTSTMTSRAFYSEVFAYFCRDLSRLCRKNKALIMNSGTEAVETAIKMIRKWGYQVKGIAHDAAEIVVFSDAFHGRTTTIVGFSSVHDISHGFGPVTPGFKVVPYGDVSSIEAAITAHTAGVILEPILGEGGIIIPPQGFLTRVREICDANRVLLVADEIQTGLCRAGKIFACEHEGVIPDAYVIGKSLGGGIVPVSAVVADDEIMQVFSPGTHGSTFGGNPFACAIGSEVLKLIAEEKPHDRAAELGAYLLQELQGIQASFITEIRGRGLMIGIDIDPAFGTAKDLCKKLKYEGLLCKDTRKQTIRIVPPLVISRSELDYGLERIQKAFNLSFV